MGEPEEISAVGLAAEFRLVHETMPDRAFAFVLGAGASKSSGIRTAAELADDWVKHLHVRSGSSQACTEWACAKALQIDGYDPSDLAGAYSALYARLYRADPAKGYAYLEDQMKHAEPSYGYSVLARILATTLHKVVVTTNFDNLVADSLSIFSTTFPLVCGHESLAAFVRARLRRPLVVKVHHDLLLAPKSAPEDLATLPDLYRAALDQLFRHYTPIVIGYGGNDGSLMGYLSDLADQTLSGGVYWCYWQGGERPREKIRKFVARQSGHLVPIAGFDELMLLLADALEFDVPDKFVLDRAQQRAARIVEQVTALRDQLSGKKTDPELVARVVAPEALAPAAVDSAATKRHDTQDDEAPHAQGAPQADPAVRDAIEGIMERTDGELRWWQWQRLINKENDLAKREEIYERAVHVLPTSAPLLGNFAVFLTNIRKDHKRAEKLYERALQAEPNHANNLGNFAQFLTNICKDHERAEKLYERALQADPNHANNLGNFAVFLENVRKDNERAEQFFEQALQADPNHANCLGNFARFELQRRRIEHGLVLLRRALALLESQPRGRLKAECWMYAYCHRPRAERRDALLRLKRLIVDDMIRTGDWDFSGVIASAIERGHEAAEWLPKLAQVLADRAPVSTLADWQAWSQT